MIYWFIIGGLFIGGVTYVMMAGANIVKEDDILQDKIAQSYRMAHQGDIES